MVLALEEAFISMCQSSWVKIFISIAKLNNRCFCYVTAAMLVSLWRTQTWCLHTKLYKFGRHISVNSMQMKNSRDLIFGEVVYITIIYHITDSWIFFIEWLRFLFWLHDWWKLRIHSLLILFTMPIFHNLLVCQYGFCAILLVFCCACQYFANI